MFKFAHIIIFLAIFSSFTIPAKCHAKETTNKPTPINLPKHFTPDDQLKYIQSGRLVLTYEDRSNPTQVKYKSFYHNVKLIIDQNLFFTKKVFTGNNMDQIDIEFQAIYITVPLQGFQPSSRALHTTPPRGHYSINSPDQIMNSDAWVMGIAIQTNNEGNFPNNISLQSPWFKLKDTKLYRKTSHLQSVPVGTIISSTLKPDIFLDKQHNEYWVEADGRNVDPDWEYSKLPSKPKTLPDLRGMFLRGVNTFSKIKGTRSDKWKDPGERSANGYQDEQIKAHRHRVPFRSQQQGHEGYGNIAAMTSYGSVFFNHAKVDMETPGQETRPKNLGVYYYIRVN